MPFKSVTLIKQNYQPNWLPDIAGTGKSTMIFHLIDRCIPDFFESDIATQGLTCGVSMPQHSKPMAVLVTAVQNQAVRSVVDKLAEGSSSMIVVGHEKNLGSNCKASEYTLEGHLKRHERAAGLLSLLQRTIALFRFFRVCKDINMESRDAKAFNSFYKDTCSRAVYSRRYLCRLIWKRMQELTLRKWFLTLKLSHTSRVVLCTIDTIPTLMKQACLFPLASRIGSVVLDEAGRVPESKIPVIALTKTKCLIAVGDQKQLDPFTQLQDEFLGKTAEKDDVAASRITRKPGGFFQRLYAAIKGIKMRVPMLKVQYRMHSGICGFLSKHMYGELLQTDRSISKLRRDSANDTWVVWMDYNLEDCIEEREIDDCSLFNTLEITVLRKLLLQEATIHFLETKSILVITFYNRQKCKIEGVIDEMKVKAKGMGRNSAMIESNLRLLSVDSAQGCESDVVILSCVRSNYDGNIGFLNNRKRICVALSRAKERVVVIGNSETLTRNYIWKSLHCAHGCKVYLASESNLMCEIDFLPKISSSVYAEVLDRFNLALNEQKATNENTNLQVEGAADVDLINSKLQNLMELVALAKLRGWGFGGEFPKDSSTNSMPTVCAKLTRFVLFRLSQAKWASSEDVQESGIRELITTVIRDGTWRQKKISMLLVIALATSSVAYKSYLSATQVIEKLINLGSNVSHAGDLALLVISHLAYGCCTNQNICMPMEVSKLLRDKLLSETMEGSPYQLELAILTICQLIQNSKFDVKAAAFCSADVLMRLINIIDEGTIRQRDYACAAISAMAERGQDIPKACGNFGVIKSLLDTLKKYSKPGTNSLENVLCAISSICRSNKAYQDAFCTCGVVPILAKLVSNGSPKQQLFSVAAISSLAEQNVALQDEFYDCGVVAHIAKIVSSKFEIYKVQAIVAMRNLSRGNHRVQNIFQEEGCIQLLINELKSGSRVESMMVFTAADALGELAKLNWFNQHLVREEEGLKMLLSLWQKDPENIQLKTSLLNVLRYNTANQTYFYSSHSKWIQSIRNFAKTQSPQFSLEGLEVLCLPALRTNERDYLEMIKESDLITKLVKTSEFLPEKTMGWSRILTADLIYLAGAKAKLNERIYAAAALNQLVTDNVRMQKYLCKKKVAALLVPMLSDQKAELRTLAAYTMSNLCIIRRFPSTCWNATSQMLLVSEHAIPPLLAAMVEVKQTTVWESAAGALLSMAAENHETQAKMVEKGALRCFFGMMTEIPLAIKRVRYGAAGLWILSSGRVENCMSLKRLGAQKKLVELAETFPRISDDETLECIVRATTSLATQLPPACRERILDNRMVAVLCSILDTEGMRSLRVRAFASEALSHFITCDPRAHGMTCNQEGKLVAVLISLLRSSAAQCRLHAAAVLRRLAESKIQSPDVQSTDTFMPKFRDAGGLRLLVSSIRLGIGSENHAAREAAAAAAHALGYFVDGCHPNQEMVRRLGGVELLAIAARAPKPTTEDKAYNEQWSALASAADTALACLCHMNSENTRVAVESSRSGWKDLTDSVFAPPPKPDTSKTTKTTQEPAGILELQGEKTRIDSEDIRQSVDLSASSGGGNYRTGEGGKPELQGKPHCIDHRNSAKIGPSRMHTGGRFAVLENEPASALERMSDQELSRKRRVLGKLLREIRTLKNCPLIQLNSQQKAKLDRENDTEGKLQDVEEEIKMRSELQATS